MMRKVLSTVLALFVALVPVSAFAAPTPWVHPGQHPFEGTPYEAAVLHEKSTGLPASEYMKGVALYQAGQCEEFFMPDGMVLQNTFTKNGKARSVQTVVQFKDAKGKSLSATDPKRRAARCRIPGRTDGATVVFPYVCKNWSLQYIPVVPVAVVAPPPKALPKWKMVQGNSTTFYSPTTVYNAGIYIPGCNPTCCPPQYINGAAMQMPNSITLTTPSHMTIEE